MFGSSKDENCGGKTGSQWRGLRGSERGWDSWGGAASPLLTPPHQLRVWESAASFHRGVRWSPGRWNVFMHSRSSLNTCFPMNVHSTRTIWAPTVLVSLQPIESWRWRAWPMNASCNWVDLLPVSSVQFSSYAVYTLTKVTACTGDACTMFFSPANVSASSLVDLIANL